MASRRALRSSLALFFVLMQMGAPVARREDMARELLRWMALLAQHPLLWEFSRHRTVQIRIMIGFNFKIRILLLVIRVVKVLSWIPVQQKPRGQRLSRRRAQSLGLSVARVLMGPGSLLTNGFRDIIAQQCEGMMITSNSPGVIEYESAEP
jgi:hypothetical protein